MDNQDPHSNDLSEEHLASQDEYKELPIKDFSYVSTPNKKTEKSNRKLPFLIIGLVVLLALVAVGTLLYMHHKAKPPVVQSTKTPTSHQTSLSDVTLPTSILKSYSSDVFNLNVKYPASWTVSQNGTSSLTIISPTTALKDAKGTTLNGKVVVTVLLTGQVPTAYGTGVAVAVLNSQQISYTNPTASQRAKTYVSFIQYASTTTLGGLDAIYITGDNGYVKDQTVPKTDLAVLNPLVVVNFLACQTASCSTPVALTVPSTLWQDTSFSGPILSILQSFSFN